MKYLFSYSFISKNLFQKIQIQRCLSDESQLYLQAKDTN